jgi:hypothetical protein
MAEFTFFAEAVVDAEEPHDEVGQYRHDLLAALREDSCGEGADVVSHQFVAKLGRTDLEGVCPRRRRVVDRRMTGMNRRRYGREDGWHDQAALHCRSPRLTGDVGRRLSCKTFPATRRRHMTLGPGTTP